MSADIHASCVAFRGKGVLLLGKSGAGKSDLALRLIDGGARLVADDRCELFLRHGKLCARAPQTIAGLLAVRGIGIIALPYAKSVAVGLAVQLGGRPPRLPDQAFYVAPAGLEPKAPVPLIQYELTGNWRRSARASLIGWVYSSICISFCRRRSGRALRESGSQASTVLPSTRSSEAVGSSRNGSPSASQLSGAR